MPANKAAAEYAVARAVGFIPGSLRIARAGRGVASGRCFATTFAKGVEPAPPVPSLTGMKYRGHMQTVVRRAVALVIFVGLLWSVQVVNWMTGYSLNPTLGLIPRRVEGLDGIIAMPMLHASFTHLAANTAPLLVMGALLLATVTRALLVVNTVVVGLGGALVWLLGSTAIHVGASGLVFGWFGFLVARGLVDRSLVTLGAALVVGFLYGSFLWGVLPGQPGVSWEAHLFGALAGVIAALVVPTRVHAPRVRGVDRP